MRNVNTRGDRHMADEDRLAICARWKMTPLEWISILQLYTTPARVEAAMKIVARAENVRYITHRELAQICGASREKTTVAVNSLRRERPEWYAIYGRFFRTDPHRETAASTAAVL